MNEDLNKRVTDFNVELKLLLGKYHLGLAAQPVISPDGRIGAVPSLIEAVDPLPEPKIS